MAARKPGGTPAVRELGRLGIEFDTHTYVHDPSTTSYGREAADTLGVDPDSVFKTLLASVDDVIVVALVPVLA
ncbi:MAG: Cys-tRNA(Pro) deacylase, partial [Nocardioidaceae bacterium]